MQKKKNNSELCKNILFLCIIKKSDIHKSVIWYEKVNNPYINTEIFVYENESTYLYEYEKYVSSKEYEEDNIIKMEYYQIIDKDFLEKNKDSPFLFNHIYNESSNLYAYDFDLFYEYIKMLMTNEVGGKKYGKTINEINIFIKKSSIENVPKLGCEFSLIYNKLAKCKQFCEYNEHNIIETYTYSYERDNNNLVPLYELMVKYRLAGLYEKGIELLKTFYKTFGNPSLFNDSTLYEEFIENIVKKNKYYNESLYTYLYYLEFEAIICYIHSAEKLIDQDREKAIDYFRIAYILCNRIMGRKMVIADEAIKQINHFRSRCIEYIKDEFIFYNQEVVKKLYEKSKLPDFLKNKDHVIFTVTTCKRFDLFEKTINSLINCTKDIDLIDEWLCVDDNSSEEDRALMKEKYPFFTYIFKKAEEKGHSKSMNMIRNYVIQSEYKYTLHMEDDWQSVVHMDYIKPCIQIIEENRDTRDGIKQVVQNRQYVQLIRQRDIDLKGGFQRYLLDGYRYILHEFYPKGSEEESQFWKRINGGFSASYWPHYSLNPSVMDSEVYKCLGAYNESVRHFEMEYASRYTNAGFKTAFFDNITRLHIGKLIGEEGKKNAYELNELVQFAQGA